MNITPLSEISHTFPAGTYWIGDPCYIYPDPEWGDFVHKIYEGTESMSYGKDSNGAICEYKGNNFFICATAHGDGCYPVAKKFGEIGKCFVDAGLLSLIPIELAESWPTWKENIELGTVIVADRPFKIKVFGDRKRPGNWEFLDYTVLTDLEEED
jgi:hypothetical protein